MIRTTLYCMVFLLISMSFAYAENPPYPDLRAEKEHMVTLQSSPQFPCKNGAIGYTIVWGFKMDTPDQRVFASFLVGTPGQSSAEILVEYGPGPDNKAAFKHAWVDKDADYKAEEFFTSVKDLKAKYEDVCALVGSEIGTPEEKSTPPPSRRSDPDGRTQQLQQKRFDRETGYQQL